MVSSLCESQGSDMNKPRSTKSWLQVKRGPHGTDLQKPSAGTKQKHGPMPPTTDPLSHVMAPSHLRVPEHYLYELGRGLRVSED